MDIFSPIPDSTYLDGLVIWTTTLVLGNRYQVFICCFPFFDLISCYVHLILDFGTAEADLTLR